MMIARQTERGYNFHRRNQNWSSNRNIASTMVIALGTTRVAFGTTLEPGSSNTEATTPSGGNGTTGSGINTVTTGVNPGRTTSSGSPNTGATTGTSERPSPGSETGTTGVASGTTVASGSSNTGATTSLGSGETTQSGIKIVTAGGTAGTTIRPGSSNTTATTSPEVRATTGAETAIGTIKVLLWYQAELLVSQRPPAQPPSQCQQQAPQYPTQVGDSFDDPNNPCVSYTCLNTGLTAVVQDCPKQTWCAEEDRVYDSKKCCYTCNTKCTSSPVNVTVNYNGCKKKVEMAKCVGECKKTLTYNYDMFQLENSCLCCREENYEYREIALDCPDGSETVYRYRHITTCSCVDPCQSQTSIVS
ncbi:Apomucin [Camelus dromedarius]|uniref:Apomucin n=1 Tax=Camelus dromedarius TaxID=9838 RepID=A0A5N4DE69_CAMDR|nr:Apomucin [Camelus dromedarius]